MEPREVASRWLAEVDAFLKGGRIPQPAPRRARVTAEQMLADYRAGLFGCYARRFESVASASEELARVVFARGGDPRPFVAIAGAIRDEAAPTMADVVAGRLVTEAIRDGASVRDSVETPPAPKGKGKREQASVNERVQNFYAASNALSASTRAIAGAIGCSHTAVAASEAYQAAQLKLAKDKEEAVEHAESVQHRQIDRGQKQKHRSDYD